MIDLHKSMVSALNTVLPTYYEMALTKDIKTPCISYMETNNYITTEPTGATRSYNIVTYQVKVWANDIETIQRYAVEVDRVLRAVGLKRTSSGELYDINSTMIQKIMTFEAIALEEF